MNFYDYLGKISIIVTPLAAAIVFGWWSYEAAYTITAVAGLSIVAGLSMAIALEGIGMMAGHIASDLYQQKDRRWLIAAFIMIIYVCVGLYELRGTSIAVVFLLSPLIYILVAMQHTVGEEKAETTAAAEDDKTWKRQQSALAAERRHELKMKKLALSFQKETAVSSIVSSEQIGNYRKPEETKKETMKRLWQPGMGVSELAGLADVSKGYASKYISNGAVQNYQNNGAK